MSLSDQPTAITLARQYCRRFALLALCAAATACSSFFHPYQLPGLADTAELNSVKHHAIFVDNDGHGILPRRGQYGKTMSDSDFKTYVDEIMNDVRVRVTTGHPKVLIRVHGGLNSLSASLRETRDMTRAIDKDAASGYYPIFINWESGLLESYGDHLFFVRQGRRSKTALSEVVLTPLYFAADVGRALTHAPITWWRQSETFLRCAGVNDADARADAAPGRPMPCGFRDRVAFPRSEDSLFDVQAISRRSSGGPDGQLTISRFAYHRGRVEAAGDLVTGVAAAIPPRILINAVSTLIRGHSTLIDRPISTRSHRWSTRFAVDLANIASWIPIKELGGIVLDAVGTPAWENMRRRTHTVFDNPTEFSNAGAVSQYRAPSGAVAVFFDALTHEAQRDAATPLHITLIGHSMGTMIVNDALQSHDTLDVDNVVFMGAALSLRDFQHGTMPYLHRHRSTQFYDLTLHPYAERREAHLLRLAPYGSLLEWIDNYFSTPEADLDLTMGKYANVVSAAFMFPPDIRPRIHIKTFGYRDGSGCGPRGLPFQHGQFNDSTVPFWRTAFWKPGIPCSVQSVDSLHPNSMSNAPF